MVPFSEFTPCMYYMCGGVFFIFGMYIHVRHIVKNSYQLLTARDILVPIRHKFRISMSQVSEIYVQSKKGGEEQESIQLSTCTKPDMSNLI